MGWGSQKYFIYLFSPTVAKLIYNSYATLINIYIYQFFIQSNLLVFFTLWLMDIFLSFAHLTTEIGSLQSCVIAAMDSSKHVFVVISNSFLDFHFLQLFLPISLSVIFFLHTFEIDQCVSCLIHLKEQFHVRFDSVGEFILCVGAFFSKIFIIFYGVFLDNNLG